MKLPPSLSPQLLGEILRFAANQRRKIETELGSNSDCNWDLFKSSDEEFYSRLHEFLQNPKERARFNVIARKHSSKRRHLALPESIRIYYSRKYPGIKAQKHSKENKDITPLDIVRLFAKFNDFECLAHVVWAFIDDEILAEKDVEELFDELPELKLRLEGTVLRSNTQCTKSAWSQALNNLFAVVEELKQTRPDTNLANRLLVTAQQIVEIAESEQMEFKLELEAVLSEHKECIDKNKELAEIRDELTQQISKNCVPKDWISELTEIHKAFTDFEIEGVKSNQLFVQYAAANIVEQQGLLDEISQSRENRLQILNSLRASVLKLFPNNSDDESPDPVINNNETDNEGTNISVDEESNTDNGIEITIVPVQNETDEIETHIGDEQCSPNGRSLTSEEQVEVEEDQDSVVQPPQATTTDSGAMELLERLVVEGNFSHAYWVARASNTLDVNILGALTEGANVEPGSACSQQLANFLDELTTKKNWSDEEKFLLVAAIIQPLLFLKPYPGSLFQVISTVPVTPLTEVVERFRNTYLSQDITLGPRAVQLDSEKTEIEDQMRQLSDTASGFIDRVRHIRLGYKPAERALRYLYQKDSYWYQLHTFIATGQISRVQEVKRLCGDLNPVNTVNTIHLTLPDLKQKLVGHARDKLLKYLHNSIQLATNWVNLVEAISQGKSEHAERQMEALKQDMISGLEKVHASLDSNQNKTATTIAVQRRISDLLLVLNGEKLNPTRIDEVCINLPGIRLDDDMIPIDLDNSTLIEAIRTFNEGKCNPSRVLEECLDNDEFVRAIQLIQNHNLGTEATDLLEKRRASRRSELQKKLDGLQSKVEEAFLLGQLWDSGEENIIRADLLSLVGDGLKNLDAEGSSLNNHIRLTSKIVDDVSHRMSKIAITRISYLQEQKESVASRFPKNEKGEEDKNYFHDTFDECLEKEDYVTAFDLLDRAQLAVDKGESIARTASTELSEYLAEFFQFADIHRREDLGGPLGPRKFREAIHNGKTYCGIHFGEIDKARRKESISVLEKWKNLQNPLNVEEVCAFVGFPIIENQNKSGINNRKGLHHIQVSLNSIGSKSPLPGFGSGLESTLDVIVSLRSQEPEQISEFIKQTEIPSGKAVLVFMTRAVSSQYRLKWLKECVKCQLMMLPLDTVLLMFLCGQRNRLTGLLNIGLPFTWAQPYITKGETVAREMFVGRKSEVSSLEDRHGACIVFGGRQLGKSALLTHVKREFHNPQVNGGLFIAYLDVNDLGESQKPDEMGRIFWKRVREQLVMLKAIDNKNEAPKRGKLSQWTEFVPNLIETALTMDKEKRIVLLLDETDKFLDQDSQSDFTLIRGLRSLMANTSRRFKVVIAGLQSVQRYNNWKNHPFAQLGNEIVINPLQPKSAEDLITRPFRTLGFKFENASLVCRIVSISNYHPGLIQIFCYRLLTNLFKNYSDWNSPIRNITEDDVLTIERDPYFKEDVRNRFDWTLDLDDRYKVITYGLVLSPNPTYSKSVKEYKELGEDWWPQVFSNMDAQAMRAVLDEMVGLGVLLREHDDDEMLIPQYRLRSPNLLRLLGPKELIDEELLRIISADKMNRPNPRNYRSLISKPYFFSPLTKEQEGHISDTNENFSLTMILGSPAMGLREIPNQIRNVMKALDITDEIQWEEIKIPTSGGATTIGLVSNKLKQQLKPHKRKHRYAIINFEELVIDGELEKFLETLVNELKKVCRANSRGKLVFILNPEWAWKWISSKYRTALEERTEFSVMTLRRWSDGAISNALDRIDLRTVSKSAGLEIFGTTDGVHSLVSETFRKINELKGESADPVADFLKGVNSKLVGYESSTLLSELGVLQNDNDLEKAVVELFSFREKIENNYIITEDSFDVAAEAFPEGSQSRNILVQHRSRIQSWLYALDLIWPANEEGTEFNLCPLMLELIKS